MIIIGIDPGANGGMCSWSSGIVSIDKCPSSAKKMSMLVSNISKNSRRDFGGKCIAYVEKVWARPSNATRAAFSFGMNYGKWIGVLESNNIDINYVLPNTWMKYWAEKYDIKISKKKKERKDKLKELASKESNMKTTLWSSDAILIASYGFQIEKEKKIENKRRNGKST